MLAPHRDQENRLRHAPVKQQPNTPGARYPKTPSRFGGRDENAAGLIGKDGIHGAQKSVAKGLGRGQMPMTPAGKFEVVATG